MNAVELALLEIVEVAEIPLYSACAELNREIGMALPMQEFLRIVDGLVGSDALRLWSVETPSGDRTELFRVPSELERRYAGVVTEDHYDPFGLSLTIGASDELDVEPDWSLDFDLKSGRFDLRARPDAEDIALEQVARYFPGLRFLLIKRIPGPDFTHLVGSVERTLVSRKGDGRIMSQDVPGGPIQRYRT